MSWTPPMPDRSAVHDDERAAYDSVVERQMKYGYTEFVKRFLHDDVLKSFPGEGVQPYFGAMLNSPLVAQGMSDLGAVYRTRGEYADGMSHADREWVDMVICDEVSCLWVLYVHAPDAIASGVRAEAILAVVRGRDDELRPEEKLKADFIRAVVGGTVTRELYGAVEELVGRRAAVEITAFTGHLLKTMRLMQAWGVPDISKVQLEEFVQALVDGKVELPEGPRVPVGGPTPA
jgi:alkylhydroperoxidase family enzyme